MRPWRIRRFGSAFVVAGLAACVIAAAVAPALADDTRTGRLEIVVAGLESDRGLLKVVLMDSAEAFDDDLEPLRSAEVPVSGESATVVFDDVPFGRYAVKVHHDEDVDGELDTNFVGFPKEPFGFSNDAMGRFGPPSFEQAGFDLLAPELRIEIHLK